VERSGPLDYQLPVPLQVVIADANQISAEILQAVLRSSPGVVETDIVSSAGHVRDSLFMRDRENYNAVFIDIFSLSVDLGIYFIDYVRTRYRHVVFCLYSREDDLRSMPGVPDEWRARFQHFYRIAKDQNLESLQAAVKELLVVLSEYVAVELARQGVGQLKARLSGWAVLQPEQAKQVEEITTLVESALQSRFDNKEISLTHMVPGVPTQQIEALVKSHRR
jgi:hypothetical protein